MTTNQPFVRDDTFLGVCYALGEDFGFNPLLLRIALAGLLFWNPPVVASAYVAAAAGVALLRWLVPTPAPAPAAAPAEEPLPGQEPMRLAA